MMMRVVRGMCGGDGGGCVERVVLVVVVSSDDLRDVLDGDGESGMA